MSIHHTMLRGLLPIATFLVILAAGCDRAEPAAVPTQTAAPPAATRTPAPRMPTATPHLPDQAGDPAAFRDKVDVGDYGLFIDCTGVGTPTVILEAGWGDAGETWHLVQPEVARHTRTCSYDRVGLGRSDAGPEPENCLEAVQDLNALLENGGVEGPYVLVGHSLGGMVMRLYCHVYPDGVVGLVLVDSSHPDSFERNAAILPTESPDDSDSLKFYRDWFSSVPRDPSLGAALLEAGSLGDLPLVVLTSPVKERAEDFPAELSAEFDRIWVELQEELALLSSNSTHVLVEGSGHFVQHDRPEVIVDAILSVVEEARDVSSHPSMEQE